MPTQIIYVYIYIYVCILCCKYNVYDNVQIIPVHEHAYTSKDMHDRTNHDSNIRKSMLNALTVDFTFPHSFELWNGIEHEP